MYQEKIVLEIGDIVRLPKAKYTILNFNYSRGDYWELRIEDGRQFNWGGINRDERPDFSAMDFVIVNAWDADYNRDTTKNYQAKALGHPYLIRFALHTGWVHSIPSIEIVGKHTKTIGMYQTAMKWLEAVKNGEIE